nr:MAG TPA: L SHAPED TAIL FIBER PROTEIN [Caudoviricetes sp.]
MVIRLDENYNAMTSTALLGYVGETNARPVSVEGLTVDGADRYVLTIDYGDGVTYEVDITGGQWTPTADILRSAQTVSCQIAAKKLSGQEYILVKKSRIFRLRIGTAIGDNAIPSPSVAADALDRISAIGEQVEADVERAENAASTAMQAAENAKKSATNAEKSAGTATQAASLAETAKASAETSATQADTARQGADTARAEAVTSQNAAKISAAQASTSAQQTTADKTITAGYAKTAKTCADSTVADRQAVQTLAEQVTADKATVADHAAKIAEDRTAAEAAAQKAQAVADSLPDDYTTAVGKIAENTAEIANLKLTDKELQRRVNALYSIGQGITHQFETDTNTAYQKTVPTGAKLMSVKSIGGHSEVIDGEIVSAGVIEVAVGDTAYPIPEPIRNLPGYGWSAGTAKNWVDYENKKYYQCVDSVDLGTLTWMKTSSQSSVGDYFYAPVSAIGFKRLGAFGITVHNILCSKYITVARNPNAFVDKTIVLDGDSIAVSQIQVKDTAYTDATAFKQAMSGVILYYELANPIVTDISSLIPDDFLRNIEVEAGGSVTFKNSNDSYLIPVPSEEEYIVKLSEVGGTT